ncbi:MAG: HAD-IIB family hydrolase [Breznakia sp.]
MKIIGSDYDGTMRLQGDVDPLLVEAIQTFRKQGNAFGIVSGRSIATLKQEVSRHHLQIDFAICNNGGVILDKDFHVLNIMYMPKQIAQEIVVELKKTASNAITLNAGEHRACLRFDETKDEKADAATIEFDILLATKQIAQVVVAYQKQEKANQIAKKINDVYGEYVCAFENVGCVDIVPFGCSKANGLAFIAEHFGYAKQDMYAIGDSYNDMSMIKEYHGASFYYAPQEIQDISSYVVQDCQTFIKMIGSL